MKIERERERTGRPRFPRAAVSYLKEKRLFSWRRNPISNFSPSQLACNPREERRLFRISRESTLKTLQPCPRSRLAIRPVPSFVSSFPTDSFRLFYLLSRFLAAQNSPEIPRKRLYICKWKSITPRKNVTFLIMIWKMWTRTRDDFTFQLYSEQPNVVAYLYAIFLHNNGTYRILSIIIQTVFNTQLILLIDLHFTLSYD